LADPYESAWKRIASRRRVLRVTAANNTHWTAGRDGVPTSTSASPATSSCPSGTTWPAACAPSWAACTVSGAGIPTTTGPARTWTWECTRSVRTVRTAAVSWCRPSRKSAILFTANKRNKLRCQRSVNTARRCPSVVSGPLSRVFRALTENDRISTRTRVVPT